MMRLSAGDNTTEVPAHDRADEIGDMARAVLVFRQGAIETERLTGAQQTGKATEQIGAQIGQIQATTQDAVTAIQAIARTIEEVSTIAAAITLAAQQQGAAATREVTANITGVSQAANDTGAAATQVLDAAAAISRQAARLSGEVDGFVAEVRAS